jgi:hypothetical protein
VVKILPFVSNMLKGGSLFWACACACTGKPVNRVDTTNKVKNKKGVLFIS